MWKIKIPGRAACGLLRVYNESRTKAMLVDGRRSIRAVGLLRLQSEWNPETAAQNVCFVLKTAKNGEL
jgi:hypothetical protein